MRPFARGFPVRAALAAAGFATAGLAGVAAMRAHGAPAPRTRLQLAALALGALLAWVLARALRNRVGATGGLWGGAAAVALTACTLLDDGQQGVRRWLGPPALRLHPSAMFAPLVVLGVAAALQHRRRAAWGCALMAAAQLVHLAQPDAGQATALALAGAAAAALARDAAARVRCALAAVSVAPALATWLRRDPLEPVPTVEGIVALVGALGAPVRLASVAALALLPLAAAPAPERARAHVDADARARPALVARAEAAYLAGALLAPIAGHFPVPVMGFGVSPIAGFAIALGLAFAATATPDD